MARAYAVVSRGKTVLLFKSWGGGIVGEQLPSEIARTSGLPKASGVYRLAINTYLGRASAGKATRIDPRVEAARLRELAAQPRERARTGSPGVTGFQHMEDMSRASQENKWTETERFIKILDKIAESGGTRTHNPGIHGQRPPTGPLVDQSCLKITPETRAWFKAKGLEVLLDWYKNYWGAMAQWKESRAAGRDYPQPKEPCITAAQLLDGVLQYGAPEQVQDWLGRERLYQVMSQALRQLTAEGVLETSTGLSPRTGREASCFEPKRASNPPSYVRYLVATKTDRRAKGAKQFTIREIPVALVEASTSLTLAARARAEAQKFSFEPLSFDGLSDEDIASIFAAFRRKEVDLSGGRFTRVPTIWRPAQR